MLADALLRRPAQPKAISVLKVNVGGMRLALC